MPTLPMSPPSRIELLRLFDKVRRGESLTLPEQRWILWVVVKA